MHALGLRETAHNHAALDVNCALRARRGVSVQGLAAGGHAIVEAKFRPIPITIMDFLGVLVPGFLWSILLLKTYYALSEPSARVSGISEVWARINSLAQMERGWLGPLTAIFASLVAGYSLKPLAMPASGILCRPVFFLLSSVRQRKVHWWKMSFPFRDYFEHQEYYPRVIKILAEATGFQRVDKLPGTVPYAAAKRYLHATLPALWEESERMEAEVRMSGTLFLAAAYSVLLHSVLYAWGYPKGMLCAILSGLAALALAFGFCILRLREVGYTYLNLLLADGLKIKDQGISAQGKNDNE